MRQKAGRRRAEKILPGAGRFFLFPLFSLTRSLAGLTPHGAPRSRRYWPRRPSYFRPAAR